MVRDMAAQDACRGQHFLVHVALCVPNMSISISMWVRPVLESFLRLSQKSKEQPDLCRSQQDCFSGISRTGECRLQFRVFGNPAAERPAGGGRLDVGQVEGGQLTFTVCLYAGPVAGSCRVYPQRVLQPDVA